MIWINFQWRNRNLSSFIKTISSIIVSCVLKIKSLESVLFLYMSVWSDGECKDDHSEFSYINTSSHSIQPNSVKYMIINLPFPRQCYQRGVMYANLFISLQKLCEFSCSSFVHVWMINHRWSCKTTGLFSDPGRIHPSLCFILLG